MNDFYYIIFEPTVLALISALLGGTLYTHYKLPIWTTYTFTIVFCVFIFSLICIARGQETIFSFLARKFYES